MKKISILAGVAVLAFSGTAIAQPQAGQRGGGELTRAEAVARAEQRFQRIDANRDGQITREEMRAGRQQRRAQRSERREQRLANLSEEQRARIAERRAQRGGLTEEQRAERRAQRRAQVQAMTAEQRAERRAQRQARRGQRGGLFAAGGTVSLDEFRGRALARFERMDLDRNGTVTREERRQARQQLRQQRQQRRAG
jgi:ribosomal protein RSM22 (predicted rRNA methylase)